MKLNRFSALAGALVAGSLALAACGGSSASTDSAGSTGSASSGSASLSGTLNGAGSTAQQAAMQAWQAGFQGANPDVTINYDPVGSGGGRDAVPGPAASPSPARDAALTTDELAKAKTRCGDADAIDLPVYVSPIALAYNLDGVDKLQLDADDDRQDLRQQDHQVERRRPSRPTTPA